MFSKWTRSVNNRSLIPADALLLPALFLFLASLSACISPEPVITSTPFPTIEAVRLDIPNLEPLLLDPIQRPPRVTSADISQVPHPSFSKLPEADHFISVLYASGSGFGGRLSIFIYAFPEDLDSVWPLVLDTIYTPREIDGPGELTAVDHSDIAFIRCNALVHIKLDGADPDEILTFADKFDADLKSLLCPSK